MRLASTTLTELHNEAVVGLWALDVARGDSVDAASSRYPAILPELSPEQTARMLEQHVPLPHRERSLQRRAALHPVAALGTALALEWLVEGDVDDVTARAAKWDAYGDAPVDVALRDLKK